MRGPEPTPPHTKPAPCNDDDRPAERGCHQARALPRMAPVGPCVTRIDTGANALDMVPGVTIDTNNWHWLGKGYRSRSTNLLDHRARGGGVRTVRYIGPSDCDRLLAVMQHYGATNRPDGAGGSCDDYWDRRHRTVSQWTRNQQCLCCNKPRWLVTTYKLAQPSWAQWFCEVVCVWQPQPSDPQWLPQTVGEGWEDEGMTRWHPWWVCVSVLLWVHSCRCRSVALLCGHVGR